MINTLNTGHLGISGLNLAASIELASEVGFRAVSLNMAEVHETVRSADIGVVRNLFVSDGVLPGDWGAPVDWMGDNRATELERLKPIAATAAKLGATTTSTWVLPGDNERDRDAQYAWYMERLRPYAQILADAGIQIGLEFIGPKTLRDQFQHEFVWTMHDMLALAKDVGTGNVGLLFDTFHFFTSGATLDDLGQLSASDIKLVHTNDAIAGVDRDDQLDGVRTLPMETGVIDAPAILRKLAEIGYTGLVQTEPFSDSLRLIANRSPEQAARLAYAAQQELFEAAGLEI